MNNSLTVPNISPTVPLINQPRSLNPNTNSRAAKSTARKISISAAHLPFEPISPLFLMTTVAATLF